MEWHRQGGRTQHAFWATNKANAHAAACGNNWPGGSGAHRSRRALLSLEFRESLGRRLAGLGSFELGARRPQAGRQQRGLAQPTTLLSMVMMFCMQPVGGKKGRGQVSGVSAAARHPQRRSALGDLPPAAFRCHTSLPFIHSFFPSPPATPPTSEHVFGSHACLDQALPHRHLAHAAHLRLQAAAAAAAGVSGGVVMVG